MYCVQWDRQCSWKDPNEASTGSLWAGWPTCLSGRLFPTYSHTLQNSSPLSMSSRIKPTGCYNFSINVCFLFFQVKQGFDFLPGIALLVWTAVLLVWWRRNFRVHLFKYSFFENCSILISATNCKVDNISLIEFCGIISTELWNM